MNERGDVVLTVVGAFNQGLLMNVADFSKEFIERSFLLLMLKNISDPLFLFDCLLAIYF